MRQFLCLVFFCGLADIAHAASNLPDGNCFRAPGASSFTWYKADGYLNLIVVHHNGARFMPIHAGIVTPFEIKVVEKKSQLLPEVLGDEQRYRWPLEKCEVYDENVFGCFGSGELIKPIPSQKVAPFSFYTAKGVESSIAGRYEYFQVRVHFEIDGLDGDTVSRYPMESCRFNGGAGIN